MTTRDGNEDIWNQLQLEMWTEGSWRPLGAVTLRESESLGLNARTDFVYDLKHAKLYTDKADSRAVSCDLPVGFEIHDFDSWPPFLLDLFPQGAALQYVVEHYRIADRPENYWSILKRARLNPPGNIRAVTPAPTGDKTPGHGKHPGFTREEVLEKGADFLKYMVSHGAPVAGSTGASGAAPKFLLREDFTGRFHADGVLEDERTKACWLVKFPRGRSERDKQILQAEEAYLDIAASVGLSVHGTTTWESDCLFVPRFDRAKDPDRGDFEYLGLESFYSMVGKPEFGSRLEHETYLKALARFSSDPKADAMEYILRDFLNQMLGNTDNHGRNSSLLKGRGWQRLSPLYDVAPMQFDPEGIVRATNWGEQSGRGAIKRIADFFCDLGTWHKQDFDAPLRSFLNAVATLEEKLHARNVPPLFIEGTRRDRQRLIKEIAAYLGVPA